jgi:hypothetical protein
MERIMSKLVHNEQMKMAANLFNNVGVVSLAAWEKTFPDELWSEFGRLTGWKGNLNSRPSGRHDDHPS